MSVETKTVVVFRGRILHVGAWPTYAIEVDGEEILTPIPYPEGTVEGEFEVVRTAHGELVLASDYEALRKAEYPFISDQLDALWKGGEHEEQMRGVVLSVKAKYPKPL